VLQIIIVPSPGGQCFSIIIDLSLDSLTASYKLMLSAIAAAVTKKIIGKFHEDLKKF